MTMQGLARMENLPNLEANKLLHDVIVGSLVISSKGSVASAAHVHLKYHEHAPNCVHDNTISLSQGQSQLNMLPN